MAIPSRQIGWGTEENLLWEISKQLEALTGVAYNSGGSGGSGTSGISGTSGTSGQNGISAGRVFYFNESQTSDVSGYKVLADEPTGSSLQTVSKTLTANQEDVLVQQFMTDELGFTIIPSGVQRFKLYYDITGVGVDVETYVTLELADSTGTGYGNIVSSNPVIIPYNDGDPIEVDVDVVFPQVTILTTDRMIVKLYLNNLDSTSRTVEWNTENGYYSYVITSVGVVAGSSGTSGISGSSGTSSSPSNKVVIAQLSTTQTITTGSDTVINYTSTADPNSWFNNSTHVFQPNIAGYYNISYSVLWNSVDGGTGQINTQITKNGSTQMYIAQSQLNTIDPQTHTSSIIVYFNGSTDNVKITGYTSSTTTSQDVNGGAGTLFTASLI